jgi:cyclase
MLRPRLIPLLLVQNGGLVKTIQFQDPKYVGDPLNAVRIFNDKEVDELIVADIDATTQNKEPDYGLIEKMAAECRMPLCYVGGVDTHDKVERIISLGVEKVGLSSAILKDPMLISLSAKRVGNQSIVVVLDVKYDFISSTYQLYTHNGKIATGIDPVIFAKKAMDLGAGEIVINSIDRDGVGNGYDFVLIQKIKDAVSIPVTALGGAGCVDDIQSLISRFGIIGAAAGSLFVFKGKFRAVLINYPSSIDKKRILNLT